jgi:modification methylase
MEMTTTKHTIINGDSRKMSEVQDGSVHLIVTSPPYWQLKDYGSEDQIGFNDSYERYINNLNLVWKECFRVLHEGCRLCINIGDQFARSVYYGRYKVIPIHSEIIRFCETIGFDFMGQIIWQKTTTTNTTGGAAIMGSYPYPRNGIVKLDFEYILLFKKAGNAPKPTREQKEMAVLSNEEWNTYFSGHWHFNGARQDKHLAMFPEELPKRLIKMFSFPQETVLDPFLGSGTTAMVAKALGRNSIGYEINADFIPLIKERVGSNNLLEKVKLEFLKQNLTIDLNKEYATLPYWFTDCHKTDKKIDVKKLQFGSKIDKESSTARSECYMVKQVVSPEQIILDNGVTVRLLGIKNNPETQKEAVDFLWSKLKGNKIFLKYDNVKFDADKNLMVYMYLGNKTFINAHLLKNRLANLDNTLEFKYKEKFKKLT